jgi:hypothetical protein
MRWASPQCDEAATRAVRCRAHAVLFGLGMILLLAEFFAS